MSSVQRYRKVLLTGPDQYHPTPLQDEDDFKIRLQSLPLNVFNTIQDLTFEAHIEAAPTSVILVTAAGRQNHRDRLEILQLNQSTRARYAKLFYERRTFFTWRRSGTREGMFHWLNNMPSEHWRFIGGILYRFGSEGDPEHHAYLLMRLKELVEGGYGAGLADKVDSATLFDEFFRGMK